ncbi:disulfide bond formation protein B [Haloplanus sp. GCM10025708]|uniref:disulfide bond formation protein B n=1 Tax=Haloferacaceae TaxID=1644056 RepID=UPI0036091EA9
MRRLRATLVGLTVVAAVATAGSLWLSLGRGLTPCRLCWYQRILMYPLVVVLGVAAVENRPRVWLTALPLSVAGVAVAASHSYLQVAPNPAKTCSIGGESCVRIQYTLLDGLLTIPRLSLAGFLILIAGLVAIARVE